MADHNRNNSQSGSFEDNFRRMIISGGPGQAASLFDSSPERGGHPAVRLPPPTSYGAPSNGSQHGIPPHLRNQQNQQSRFANQSGLQHSNISPNRSIARPLQNEQYGRQNHQQSPYGPQENFGQQRDYRSGHQQSFSPGQQQRARHQQQMQLDPNAFHRGGLDQSRARGDRQQQLFNPHQPRTLMRNPREQQHAAQALYLDKIATSQIATIDMTHSEYQEKDNFRVALDNIIRHVCTEHPSRIPKTSLEAFGSFKSGFATAGSDMDLVIVVEDQGSPAACFSLLEDDLPRVLEKKLLDLGYGARLLTRTRVPIIKVCEKPGGDLLEKLREEREKWDILPEHQKYPHLYAAAENGEAGAAEAPVDRAVLVSPANPVLPTSNQPKVSSGADVDQEQIVSGDTPQTERSISEGKSEPKQARDESKPWTRERRAGPLDFPKSGVGIHSDINFFNPLGIHNTHLLRCYSLCDARVRPIVLFVKAWAKQRKINSSYSGTLSSYGYVLMVLHYLVNVADPPVLPNLQTTSTALAGQEVDGWQVKFWRDELEITHAVQRGVLTQNRESIGSLLAGFFRYYSSLGGGPSFHWMQGVLSLRSEGGILTKEEKGWVRAVTEEGEGKRVQHRYLFCIEDPFELSHNVARTVTHRGIVAIRDEFRRAHRILLAVAYGRVPAEGELCAELDETVEQVPPPHKGKSNGSHANGVANPVNGANAEQNGASPHPQAGQAKRFHQHQQPHNSQTPTRARDSSRPFPTHPKPTPNLSDSSAFPALASPAAKTPQSKKKASRQARDVGDDFSEISGDQARVVLEEVRKRRDEAMAESTARGAAESVLEGFD